MTQDNGGQPAAAGSHLDALRLHASAVRTAQEFSIDAGVFRVFFGVTEDAEVQENLRKVFRDEKATPEDIWVRKANWIIKRCKRIEVVDEFGKSVPVIEGRATVFEPALADMLNEAGMKVDRDDPLSVVRAVFGLDGRVATAWSEVMQRSGYLGGENPIESAMEKVLSEKADDEGNG